MSLIKNNDAGYVRDEVLLDITKEKSKQHPVFGCMLFFFACVIFVVAWVAWVIASTGLFFVPVFSSLAFHEPKPIRVVDVGVPVETLAESSFKSVLAERLQSENGKLTDRHISLTIPESSLTATLRQLLKQTPIDFVDQTRAQVAVLPDQQFELFIPLKNTRLPDGQEKQKSAAIAHIALTANHGVIQLVLKDVTVGSFHAPQFVIASLVQSYVNAQLGSINQALGSYMEVDEITYKQGSVILSGNFTVQLK